MITWWKEEFDGVAPNQFVAENAKHMTDAEIANRLCVITGRDVSPEAVRHKRRQLKIRKDEFPASRQPVLNEWLDIRADSVLSLADIHADLQDSVWLEQVVGYAQNCGVQICVITGDLFDLSVLSRFTPAVNSTPTVDGDLQAVQQIVAILSDTFNEVYIVLGNHDIRFINKLGPLGLEFYKTVTGANRENSNVTVSEYRYAVIADSNGERWRLTHPRNYSAVPVTVARALADKYRMNVVAAHGHDWGQTTSVSGYYAAASGMIADPMRFTYTMHEDSCNPVMQQGAWLLVDTRPVLLHPKWNKPI